MREKEAIFRLKSRFLLLSSIKNFIIKFYDGILAYTNGVDQCYEGSILLAQGTDKLAGAVSSVKHGSSELVNSVANFQDGSLSLLDGMEGFDKETLEKLIKMMSDNTSIVLVSNSQFYQLFKDQIPAYVESNN